MTTSLRNAYPFEVVDATIPLLMTSVRYARNPDVQSRTSTPSMRAVYQLPTRDNERRTKDQFSTPPRVTYREPITTSAPSAIRCSITWMTSGSCERSQSMVTITS